MGKALYREYRPKKLSDVVGQSHITDTLQNALKKGAIAHAYLLTGPKGVGKTSIARILAHEINELPYNDETMHLDIIEIDAASNRRIDEIRDLRDKVHIAPTSAKYKVYIIDEVHMLTREAFNALLKTLEEPPAHVVFILATTEAHKVPDTIVSRTQRYTFRPIEQNDAVAHLRKIANTENLKITDTALQLLADHGRGSFRDSISMLDQIAGFGHKEITSENLSELLGIPSEQTISSLLEALRKGDSALLFDAVQTLRAQGSHPSLIAAHLISLMREQLINMTTTLGINNSIQLMKALLPLTGAQASYEALEIALLDALLPTEDSEASTPVLAPSVESKPVTSSDKQPTSETKLPKETVPEKAQELLEHKNIVVAEEIAEQEQPAAGSEWQNILNALKGNHNTLYGVIRMASAQITDNSIRLQFQFAFHKKQVTQAKHLATLQSVVEKVLGKKYEMILDVKETKSQKPIDKLEQPTATSATLESVSNIFGGAELLES